MDYDGQRHSFQALQNSKKREEVKISRAKDQLEEAKRTFALFNAELNEELPALFESRLLFLITNLQTFFSAEQVFHNELSKVHGELESIIDKLAKETSGRTSSSHYARRSSPPTQMLSSPASNSLSSPDNGENHAHLFHYRFYASTFSHALCRLKLTHQSLACVFVCLINHCLALQT